MKKTEILKGSATFIRAYDKPEDVRQWLLENPMTVGLAFVGRSNVGKSSLINSLFGNKTAKTSKTPGRTQKINIFIFKLNDNPDQNYVLFDLPGYGHAEVSKQMIRTWGELMDSFFGHITPRVLLLNIQDARHPNQKSDQQFSKYIKFIKSNIFLIFNKIDKLKKQKEKAALNKLKPEIYKEFKHVKQIYFASAEKKTGLDVVEQSIISHLKMHSDLIIHSDDLDS